MCKENIWMDGSSCRDYMFRITSHSETVVTTVCHPLFNSKHDLLVFFNAHIAWRIAKEESACTNYKVIGCTGPSRIWTRNLPHTAPTLYRLGIRLLITSVWALNPIKLAGIYLSHKFRSACVRKITINQNCTDIFS